MYDDAYVCIVATANEAEARKMDAKESKSSGKPKRKGSEAKSMTDSQVMLLLLIMTYYLF